MTRFEDGKIAEEWASFDAYDFMQQMGLSRGRKPGGAGEPLRTRSHASGGILADRVDHLGPRGYHYHLKATMALSVGSHIAHSTVTALIGEGGMGQVCQATATKLNRQVALKILPEAFASDPDRFLRGRSSRLLSLRDVVLARSVGEAP